MKAVLIFLALILLTIGIWTWFKLKSDQANPAVEERPTITKPISNSQVWDTDVPAAKKK